MLLLNWSRHLPILQLIVHTDTAAASNWKQQNSASAPKKHEMIQTTS